MGCLQPGRSRPGMATGRLSCSFVRAHSLGTAWSVPPPESSASIIRGSRSSLECGTDRRDGFASAADIVASAIGVRQSTGLRPDGHVAEVDQALSLVQDDELLMQGRQPTQPPGITSVTRSRFQRQVCVRRECLFDAAGTAPRVLRRPSAIPGPTVASHRRASTDWLRTVRKLRSVAFAIAPRSCELAIPFAKSTCPVAAFVTAAARRSRQCRQVAGRRFRGSPITSCVGTDGTDGRPRPRSTSCRLARGSGHLIAAGTRAAPTRPQEKRFSARSTLPLSLANASVSAAPTPALVPPFQTTSLASHPYPLQTAASAPLR